MNTNTTSTINLGSLTIVRRTTCNRIDACAVQNDYGHQFFFCANCGRDLEVTTGANGFRHGTGFAVVAIAEQRQAQR